jgi:hypothetical protein
MAIKYNKWLYDIPTLSISRPSKNYPNWDFWSDPLATLRCGQTKYKYRYEHNKRNADFWDSMKFHLGQFFCQSHLKTKKIFFLD